ncbi:MAG: ATP-binding protein [Candidatus Omnitrophica bacterium]|nr:ATP-binding protein [Candidatus Omnitrophota bacterium]
MKKRPRKRTQGSKKTLPSRRLVGACGKPFGERKCHNFCQLTSDMIQMFRAEGTILDANPAWHQALEYSDKDLSQITIFNVIHPNDKKESEGVFLAVLRDGKPRKFQATFIGKSGKEIKVEGIVSRLLHQGRPFALSGIFHDVTRNMHYEQLKDEFISTISHELRTPLTVVREGISQIRDELLGPVPDNQKILLDMALQNSDRLSRIIEELLDVSKLEAGKVRLHRKLCDIAKVASEVIANFKVVVKRKNLEILQDFVPQEIEIYIDRDKIVQVLTNLINNSLKFTDAGHIKVHLRVRDGFVECKISDTGKGISEEDLPKAFHKFSQFAREVGPGDRGTGLGLSICKKLIELHHGRVKIESVPMKGTTVTFLLPQYTHRDLFKDSIGQAMSRCVDGGSPLSIIIFDILDFEALEEKLGSVQMGRIVVKMEKIMNDALRRVADVAIKDTKAIMILLPDTKKENAFIVMGRLSQILEDFLIREQMHPKIEVHGNVVCFPEEAKTLEEILDGIYA